MNSQIIPTNSIPTKQLFSPDFSPLFTNSPGELKPIYVILRINISFFQIIPNNSTHNKNIYQSRAVQNLQWWVSQTPTKTPDPSQPWRTQSCYVHQTLPAHDLRSPWAPSRGSCRHRAAAGAGTTEGPALLRCRDLLWSPWWWVCRRTAVLGLARRRWTSWRRPACGSGRAPGGERGLCERWEKTEILVYKTGK